MADRPLRSASPVTLGRRMNMKSILTIALSVLLVTGCVSTQQKQAREASQKKAELWFQYLDQGQGKYLWAVTADDIQERRFEKAFIKYYLGKRKPLGKVIKRKLQYNWKLDSYHVNLADGTYRLLNYWTEYENKSHTEEFLVLTLQDDGQWKVVEWDIK